MTDRQAFPFCADRPVALSGRGWLILLGALTDGFALLSAAPRMAFPASLIPSLLFWASRFWRCAAWRGGWTALFGPVGPWQIAQMAMFGLLTLALSLAVGLALMQVAPLSANPIAQQMRHPSAGRLAALMIPTIPQLVGEELLGILPFLAIWSCTRRLDLSQGKAVIIGVLVSAVIFGIGSAWVVLTMAYAVSGSPARRTCCSPRGIGKRLNETA